MPFTIFLHIAASRHNSYEAFSARGSDRMH